MSQSPTPLAAVPNDNEPLSRVIRALDVAGCEPAPSGDQFAARCPAHDDASPSLSVGVGADGRVLIHCFAGCGAADVLDALGLSWSDVFPATAYVYETARGEPRQVVKREDRPNGEKKITQYRYEDGRLIPKAPKPKERIPYNLPALRDAVERGETVYVVEGEKCADALEGLGLVATCNPGGAGKWRDEYAQHFGGADVVILPDNDEPGRAHADTVAKSLAVTARSVRTVTLPDLPEKGDVVDWIEAGGTVERLREIVGAAPEMEPERDAEVEKFLSRLLSVEQILQIPPPEWVIDGILQDAPVSVLYGDGGSFKSFLALDWSLCMASGRDWHGRKVRRERTLYIAAEGTGGLGVRMRAWLERAGVEAVDEREFQLYPGAVSLLNRDTVRVVIEAIRALGFTRLVVDTLRRSMPGGDENSAKDVGTLLSAVGEIYEETGARSLILHHANRDGSYRGSSAIFDDPDNVLKLKRNRQGDALVAALSSEKTKDGEEFDPLTLRMEKVGDSLVIGAVEGGTVDALGLVVEAVQAEPGTLTTGALEDRLGDTFTQRQIRAGVKKAESGGLIERASKQAPWRPTKALEWARRGFGGSA